MASDGVFYFWHDLSLHIYGNAIDRAILQQKYCSNPNTSDRNLNRITTHLRNVFSISRYFGH
jgi:hypothetical protein